MNMILDFIANNDNIYLREASRNGSVKIVILLLQDKRIDPSADDNLAISIAGMFGNDDIVDVFYKNYLVNSSLKKNNRRLYGLLKNRFIKNKIGGF